MPAASRRTIDKLCRWKQEKLWTAIETVVQPDAAPGDREALIQAALLHAWDRLDVATEAADAEEPVTADGATSVLLRLMPPEAAERNLTDGLLLLREDIRNPVLRARGAAWGGRLARALGRRMDPASGGERLGWQMASVWQGAQTWWAFTRDGPPEVSIRRALEDWRRTLRPEEPPPAT